MSKRNRKKPEWIEEYVPEEVANSTLFKFVVSINKDQKFEVDMTADLNIDYSIIQQQLEDTPSEFVYWGAILSELKMQAAILERKIKARRGKLTKELVDEANRAGVRVTDKQVTAMIEADEKLNILETKYLLMQKHVGKMYFMVDAIRMKSESIRSLSGFAKIDYQSQQ